MENIQIGTELVLINHYLYSNVIEYTFSKIARLTKTQGILENGVKVRLEKNHCDVGSSAYLLQVGEKPHSACRWYFATDEIRQAAKNELKRRFVERTFKAKVFTFAEKEWILKNLPANLK